MLIEAYYILNISLPIVMEMTHRESKSVDSKPHLIS